MTLLALESSAVACSVALWGEKGLIAQSFQHNGLTHSQTLLPMLDSLLAHCDISLQQISALAVAIGPGSFTGLRIGVATAKGLAWARGMDCIPCSTLEAMAWPLAFYRDHLIVCAMDARRSQIYHGLFWADGERITRKSHDQAISCAALQQKLQGCPHPIVVVGDGAMVCYPFLRDQQLKVSLAPAPLRMQSAWGVAAMGWDKLERGEVCSGEDLVPQYHRLSQAERERLRRLGHLEEREG